jgi:uncharacterized protein YjbI with pentapeptide repeats
MKIVSDTWLSLGWVVCKIRPPVLAATIFVKGTFALALDQSPQSAEKAELPSGDRYANDDPAQALTYATDFVPFKPRADILIIGTAHAPGGRAVPTFPVGIRVGTLQKKIDVIGKRAWSRGGAKGPAEPIARLPLTYANAFGGIGFARNPLGKGIIGDELPNLELPSARLESPKSRPDPAGFGPLPAAWEQRSKLVGTYGRDYVKKYWPWFPADFDWGYFNAAPADQQVVGYLRGDESLEFHNLHAHLSNYGTHLPGLRTRLFATISFPRQPEQFVEVPVRLDTMVADLDAMKLFLVWRGSIAIATPLMREVTGLFAMTESLAAPPGTPEQYRAERDSRIAAGLIADEVPVDSEEAAEDAVFERELAASNEKLAEADAHMAKMEAEAEATWADGQRQLLAMGVDPAALVPGPAMTLAQSATAAEVAYAAELARIPDAPADLTSVDLSEFKQMEQEFAEQDQPPATRESVAEAAKRKESLADRDFFEVDLSGLDFSGVDLSGSSFTGAKLVGAKLARANLSHADLSGVDLSGSDLTNANLDSADLTGCVVTGAKLTNLSLNYATLTGLDLKGADLSGSRGRGTDLSGAILTGADFVAAELPSADFSDCALDNADFTRAVLVSAIFEKARAPGIVFREANLSGLHAEGADFSGGQFQRATGDRAVFERAILNDADFSRATMNAAQFGEASAERAIFDRALLTSATFNDAMLANAKLTNANLLRAAMERADLTDANLAGSNLYGAGFWETHLENVDFSKANLKGTMLS